MSIKDSEDECVSVNLLFRTRDIEEHEQWIESGYFKSHEDIAAYAYTMTRQVVKHLEQERIVRVDIATINIDMEFDIPERLKKHSLQ